MSQKNNSQDSGVSTEMAKSRNLYNDVIVEEDWTILIEKHSLRYEIWEILKIYGELNVTEINHLVKQSKSTVSRVLRAMENDNLGISRRGQPSKEEGEKIPPKYYRINETFKREIEAEIMTLEPPEDIETLRKFYMSEIKNYRNFIYNHQKLLDLLIPLLNIIEDQIEDTEDLQKAKYIIDTYLSGKNEPWFNLMYFDEERFEKFLDIRLEYLLKLEKLAREKELDVKNSFVYLDASLPLKAIFEIKKDKILKS